MLWRIHAVSALLMMSQAVPVMFMLVWLVEHPSWSATAASEVGGHLATAQCIGPHPGRLLVRPRRLTNAIRPHHHHHSCFALFLLTPVDDRGSRYYVLLMIAISVTAVLNNGLEATVITKFHRTVLERARYGPFRTPPSG
ncbi:hypothetical protein [Mycobacterium lepromatosis]|uniref:hypothetical protein n=1 Tax=Mycobacterium lepromatosis TaxID=480418 RepID=UPI0009E405BB|nr:hypothetical protein [Mycobacterium lepromatosis]